MRWNGGWNVLAFGAISGRFDAVWQAMTETCAANGNQALNAD